MKQKFIIMDSSDNCATSLIDIEEGEVVEIDNGNSLIINQLIPFGHKFALIDINKGIHIIKYSEIIGIAIIDIKAGDWIHTHNIKSAYLEGTK